MNAREKTLAAAVGGVVALILNYSAIEFFLKNEKQLRSELTQKQSALEINNAVLTEKPKWDERGRWVSEHQFKLTKENSAGVKLFAQVQAVAAKTKVTLGPPSFDSKSEKRAYCVAVFVTFDATSTWSALCDFMREIQGSGQFVVFEKVTLKVDSSDKTLMQGTFRVSKWFAPK